MNPKPLHIVVTHTRAQAVQLFEQAVTATLADRGSMKAQRATLRIEHRGQVTEWVPAEHLQESVRGRSVTSWEACKGVRLGPEITGYLDMAALV